LLLQNYVKNPGFPNRELMELEELEELEEACGEPMNNE
jgi:hypothetical protein